MQDHNSFYSCLKDLLRTECISNHEILLRSTISSQINQSSKKRKCLSIKNVIKCNAKCHSSVPSYNNDIDFNFLLFV